jgi:hypothetical protein
VLRTLRNSLTYKSSPCLWVFVYMHFINMHLTAHTTPTYHTIIRVQQRKHRRATSLYLQALLPLSTTHRPSSSSQKPQRASKSLSQLSVSAPCVGVCGVSSHYSRSPICPSHRHTLHTKSVPAPVRTVLPLRTGTCRPPPWQREIKMRAVGRSPCGSNLPNWVVRKGPVGGMNCSYFFATHPVATVNDHLLVKSNFLRF